MVDVREAYEKAKKQATTFELANVKETSEVWIFNFYKLNEKGLYYPQAPIVTVNKETGELGRLVIPPLKNLDILKQARLVEFKA